MILEASKLAQKMILYYGMGSNVIMPYIVINIRKK